MPADCYWESGPGSANDCLIPGVCFESFILLWILLFWIMRQQCSLHQNARSIIWGFSSSPTPFLFLHTPLKCFFPFTPHLPAFLHCGFPITFFLFSLSSVFLCYFPLDFPAPNLLLSVPWILFNSFFLSFFFFLPPDFIYFFFISFTSFLYFHLFCVCFLKGWEQKAPSHEGRTLSIFYEVTWEAREIHWQV